MARIISVDFDKLLIVNIILGAYDKQGVSLLFDDTLKGYILKAFALNSVHLNQRLKVSAG